MKVSVVTGLRRSHTAHITITIATQKTSSTHTMRSFGETPLHARKRVSAMTVQSVTRSLP
ncbi:MAG: hypothetical protein NTU45_13335 [Planctomycetota bacterium]|nr:hypothetical protein [Planctomycetota bacterium]